AGHERFVRQVSQGDEPQSDVTLSVTWEKTTSECRRRPLAVGADLLRSARTPLAVDDSPSPGERFDPGAPGANPLESSRRETPGTARPRGRRAVAAAVYGRSDAESRARNETR